MVAVRVRAASCESWRLIGAAGCASTQAGRWAGWPEGAFFPPHSVAEALSQPWMDGVYTVRADQPTGPRKHIGSGRMTRLCQLRLSHRVHSNPPRQLPAQHG